MRSDYILGPRDLLEIKVFELPELNVTVRVSEDGKINLPLIGTLTVAGLSAFELESLIKRKLDERFLKDAQVGVFIQEYRSSIVSVMGAVRSPKDYQLVGQTTLLQMISMAGGITEKAGKMIHVFRTSPDGVSDKLEIEIERLLYGGEQRYNIPLLPGDIVNIPIDREVSIYIFGEVLKPGSIKFRESDKMTLLTAIASAGGFTDRASRGGVTLKRIDDQGREQLTKINVRAIIKGKQEDVMLQAEDIIIVQESFF